MIRGTTPTHTFEIPFDTELLKEVRISYVQDNEKILEKTTEDCELAANMITTTLSQEDTLEFSHRKIVEIQLKVLTNDGCCLATNVIRKDIAEILNEEVLT